MHRGRSCRLAATLTAAIVIAAGLQHHSKLIGIEHGLHKVGEVLLGCLMGLVVTIVMSRLWPVHEPKPKPEPSKA